MKKYIYISICGLALFKTYWADIKQKDIYYDICQLIQIVNISTSLEKDMCFANNEKLDFITSSWKKR